MMPLATYLTIRPGDLLRTVRNGVPRLVLTGPSPTVGGGLTGLAFFRVGHSWTGQNPVASYDAFAIRQLFEVTGRRGCTRALASEWATWWDRLLRATIDHLPLPPLPEYPREWAGDGPRFMPDESQIRKHVAKWRELQRRGQMRQAST